MVNPKLRETPKIRKVKKYIVHKGNYLKDLELKSSRSFDLLNINIFLSPTKIKEKFEIKKK